MKRCILGGFEGGGSDQLIKDAGLANKQGALLDLLPVPSVLLFSAHHTSVFPEMHTFRFLGR